MARGASGVWLRAVCRLGLLCRGTVYLLVGYLALRLALAAHGRTGAPDRHIRHRSRHAQNQPGHQPSPFTHRDPSQNSRKSQLNGSRWIKAGQR
jgi:hypothetical protein